MRKVVQLGHRTIQLEVQMVHELIHHKIPQRWYIANQNGC